MPWHCHGLYPVFLCFHVHLSLIICISSSLFLVHLVCSLLWYVCYILAPMFVSRSLCSVLCLIVCVSCFLFCFDSSLFIVFSFASSLSHYVRSDPAVSHSLVTLSLMSFSVVTPSHIALCSPLFLVFSSFLPSSMSWFLFLVPCSQFPVLGFVFMYLECFVSSLVFWSNSCLLHSIS